MSKVSNGFSGAISSYIENETKNDTALQEAVKNENKSIDDCCNFIINNVKKMGVSALADEEVFAMAKAYYMDEKVQKVAKVSCKVVVASSGAPKVEKPKAKTTKSEDVNKHQMSIFDLLES